MSQTRHDHPEPAKRLDLDVHVVRKITEGDRNQRIKLDQAPRSPSKLLCKSVKHGLWLLLTTGLSFVDYFTPIRELLLAYAVMLLLMLGLLAAAFCMRLLAGLDVSRDRRLYRENATGWIENVYSLKIISKSQREQVYQLSTSSRQRAALRRTAGAEVATILDVHTVNATTSLRSHYSTAW